MMNASIHRVKRKLQQREWKCNKRRFVYPNVSCCCISDALRVPTVKPYCLQWFDASTDKS